jgi:hypothetical protein
LRKFAEFSPIDVNTIPADAKSGIGAEIYYVARPRSVRILAKTDIQHPMKTILNRG